MGKRQHQKDKMYVTNTEWSTLFGGKEAAAAARGPKAAFRRLPFDCCSLSLQPFENPYCTKDGIVYDLLNIVPFLKKYGRNPTTGEPLEAKSLIRLSFHKNSDGKYHCPVTYKVFNENTHLVAIRTTGNVYCMEAVEQLNLKPRHLKDLLTDEPFVRADIISLQDPTNLDKFNLANFHHIKHNLKVEDEGEEAARKDSRYHLKTTNAETEYILEELGRTYKAPEKEVEASSSKATSRNAAHYSTGRMAAAFTATSLNPVTQQEDAVISEDVLRYAAIKKKGSKGYVRMRTNKGDLNFEIHCGMVPKTCENFLKHCKSGYYNGTIFHRSIRNFMIQGGDPTGTGKGGESAFGKPFEDEFKPNLTHSGRGVLSMANSGPNTNKSQFFITFRSCNHLDNKHSVFGRLVGGGDVLNIIEKVEVDAKDRPKEKIRLEECVVFVDPFEEIDEEMAKQREAEAESKQKAAQAEELRKSSVGLGTEVKVHGTGVGKYITAAAKRSLPSEQATTQAGPQPKRKAKGTFGNFSSW